MKDFWAFPGPETILGIETKRFGGTDLTDVGGRGACEGPSLSFQRILVFFFFLLTTLIVVLLSVLLTSASCSPHRPLPGSIPGGGSRHFPNEGPWDGGRAGPLLRSGLAGHVLGR